MTSCTAPIDIPTGSSVNPIKGTFNVVYSPDMCSDALLTVSNDRTHLSLACSGSGSAISFYGTPYVPSEIRVYAPSLHTYNGAKADAELLIVHNPGSGSGSGSDGLIVSVPVSLTSSSSDNVDLAAIIQAANTISVATISVNPSVSMNYDVNANNFIPNKPFYVYSGTLPYDSCGGNYSYAVFTDNISAAGPLSALVASNIASVQQSMKTNLQKSNAGPVTGADAGTGSAEDYVLFEMVGDCDDDDGSGGSGGSGSGPGFKPSIRTTKSSVGMNIVWGVLIALFLLGLSYLFLTRNDTAVSAGTAAIPPPPAFSPDSIEGQGIPSAPP